MARHRKLSTSLGLGLIAMAALTSTPARSLGAEKAGEGFVDLVAWPGYIERGESDPKYDWVTGFEKETGCKVRVKIAGTSDGNAIGGPRQMTCRPSWRTSPPGSRILSRS